MLVSRYLGSLPPGERGIRVKALINETQLRAAYCGITVGVFLPTLASDYLAKRYGGSVGG